MARLTDDQFLFQNHYRVSRSICVLQVASAFVAAAALAGCGIDALTLQTDERGWSQARTQAAELVQRAHEAADPAVKARLYAQAENKYKLAVDIAKRMQGANPDHLANSYMDIGALYQEEQRFDEAKEPMVQAFRSFAELSEKNNKSSDPMLRNLMRLNRAKAALRAGEICRQRKELPQAESYLRDAMQIRTYGLGVGNLLDEAQSQLVAVLEEEGKHADAIKARMEKPANPLDDF